MLFAGSRNIGPSRGCRGFGVARCMRLHCGRALWSRVARGLGFWGRESVSSCIFWDEDLMLGGCLADIIPRGSVVSEF